MKYFRFLFVFFVLSLVHRGPVFAEGGLSVEPVFQNVSFSAEVAETDFLVTLTNTTTNSLILRSSVVDFGSLDDSGGVAFLGSADSLERKYGLADWMLLEKDVISLDPGEREQFRVVIDNRESLSPGGHYGAVLFQIGTDGFGDDKNLVAVNQTVSVLVFAQKRGGERYNLLLQEVPALPSPFLIPVQIKLRFQNGGNVHVVPRGVVTLTDPLGRVVKKGVINPESGIILPETLRMYTTTLRSVVPVLFPGFYTLTIAHRYDGKEDFMYEQRAIFLFPWQSIALLCVGAVVYGMRRWHIRKKLLEKDTKERDIK